MAWMADFELIIFAFATLYFIPKFAKRFGCAALFWVSKHHILILLCNFELYGLDGSVNQSKTRKRKFIIIILIIKKREIYF